MKKFEARGRRVRVFAAALGTFAIVAGSVIGIAQQPPAAGAPPAGQAGGGARQGGGGRGGGGGLGGTPLGDGPWEFGNGAARYRVSSSSPSQRATVVATVRLALALGTVRVMSSSRSNGSTKPTIKAVCSGVTPTADMTAASMNSDAEGTGAVPNAARAPVSRTSA